jgi:predicted alpha/beta superfamily hydrolase
MKRIFFLFFTICLTVVCFGQTGVVIKKKSPFILGERVELYSNILQEERILNIYLPQGYSADSAREYPTIYVLDGSADEDFIHVAGLVQFLSFPWIQGMPECVVVGIGNVDRRRDFTYSTRNEKDKTDFPTTGGSAKFIEFLALEVQPLIKTSYHGNTTHTLVGQSLGGLVATEILIKKPEMFDHYLIVSPSVMSI